MMEFINVTNHEITMLKCKKLKDGECKGYNCRECSTGKIFDIKPSGIIASATPIEELYKTQEGFQFFTMDWKPNKESDIELAKLEDELFLNRTDNYLLLGSVIAAQAFPERVYSPVPVPGFERAKRDKKLVRSDKFTVFPRSNN